MAPARYCRPRLPNLFHADRNCADRKASGNTMQPVSLSRLCLAADGRVKANFSDNSVLLLAASGAAFIHTCGSEPTFRQLSEYAISRYAPKLAVALQFRNMHWDTPYLCPALKGAMQGGQQGEQQGMTLGYRLAEVWWPSSAAEALSAGLVQCLPDGSLAVSATDSSARIVLQGNRQRLAVCYPLLASTAGGQYHYVWQTQVFSLDAYPARWADAVALLLAVAEQQWSTQQPDQATDHGSNGHHGTDLLTPQHSAAGVGGVAARLPQGSYSQRAGVPGSHGLQESHHQAGSWQHEQQSSLTLASQRHPAPATVLPEACTPIQPSAPDGFPPNSWWFEPSLTLMPHEELLLLEWTPEATYQFNPDSGEVCVWLHSDDTCVCSERQGRFMRHTCCRPQWQQKLYAATCVPEHVWVCSSSSTRPGQEGDLAQSQQRCPLAKYSSHALKFRERMCCVVASQRSREGEDAARDAAAHDSGRVVGSSTHSFHAISDEVLDCSELPGQGTLTAYTDGRVRAFFTDRTIMHLNTNHTHCKVILPDGKSLTVATDNPVGVEGHMKLVMDYVKWAFMAPEERQAAMKAHAVAAVQAAASERMAKLLDWSLTSAGLSPHTPGQQPLQDATNTQAVRAGHLAEPGLTSPLNHPTDMRARVAHMLQRNSELASQL